MYAQMLLICSLLGAQLRDGSCGPDSCSFLTKVIVPFSLAKFKTVYSSLYMRPAYNSNFTYHGTIILKSDSEDYN